MPSVCLMPCMGTIRSGVVYSWVACRPAFHGAKVTSSGTGGSDRKAAPLLGPFCARRETSQSTGRDQNILLF